MGSRSDSTSRVTAATAAWLWRQGSRIIVPEVGLTREGSFLVEPWGSKYRADLVADLDGRTHVIEVKGTRADLAREDLSSGKWTLAYPNFCVWLAYDQKIEPPPELDGRWGLLKVAGTKVAVARRAREVDDDRRERSLRVMASVLCMQGLPTLMSLTQGQKTQTLVDSGFDRPWRRWTDNPAPRRETRGHIL